MKENPSLLDDFSNRRLLALAALTVLLLFVFYLPTLFSGYEWYFSDITYFFEPFCRFVRSNIQNGIFPLWNPYLYSGMPQLAMPCPGLFYPMSWFMFLMPFSAGLSSYMIFHHIILGIGSYVYLRDLKFTRAASIFGAIAVTLCGYNFSFVRNCTLPASMAWLPFSLYFERHITTANGKSPLINMLGLAFCVSMMMHVARPEVGAPELILLGLCSISKPCLWIWTRGKEKPHFRDSIYKLASIVLGIVLALPTIVPGIEWTALSTRAKGMAQRWVFTWSAN